MEDHPVVLVPVIFSMQKTPFLRHYLDFCVFLNLLDALDSGL